MNRQEWKDFFDNQVWMVLAWIISALLAYRTAPESGMLLWVSVCTGALYLICWALVLRADVNDGKHFSPVMILILVLMALAGGTLLLQRAGWNTGIFVGLSLLWMVPVGLPLEGIALLTSEQLRSDAGLATVSVILLAVLLVIRVVWHAVRSGRKAA